VVRADSRQGDKFRGHLRHQPLPLRVESGDVLRENLVASGHRSQRELCRRFYVLGRPTEAKTAYHSYECFRREVAQAPAECLGSGNEHGLEEVGRLDTRLHRRALLSVRIIPTLPSPLLGTPAPWPARTARAAASASLGSELPRRGR